MSDRQLRQQQQDTRDRGAAQRTATLAQAAHYRQLRANQQAAAQAAAAQQSGS